MTRRSLRWQLYPSYLLITVMAVVALTWWAIHLQDRFFLQRTEDDLIARARIIEQQVAPLMAHGERDRLQQLAHDIGRRTGMRVTIILADGVVAGDSDEDPTIMGNHASRPEVAAALTSGLGLATRYSTTLQKRLMYIALRSDFDGRAVGIVRVAIGVAFIDRARETLRNSLILAGLVIALLAAFVNYFVSARITRPLQTLRKGASRFARGFLNRKLPVPSTAEIGDLAKTLNDMAAQLNQRIATIDEQRQEQQAVLSSMAEGVIAIDSDRRLLNINSAAARLLGIGDVESTLGQTIHETIRNSALQKIVHDTLKSGQARREEITVTDIDTEAIVLVSANTLRDRDGEHIGCVVVLNDVTTLRRLEQVRKEFVGNVSHELKTPITSIKGSVETLLDGALDDPIAAQRFLNMAARQTDRLHHIVEDLLSLSRLESSGDNGRLEFQRESLKSTVESAIADCRAKADHARIRIIDKCEQDIMLPLSVSLIEQALVNLIDNAVNCSPADTEIHVEYQKESDLIALRVTDQGCGIAPQHLPRLFERFYRVDEARSRKEGGTGLGLAIVKHIALVHGGSVDVESSLGRGSTFTIHLPIE